MTTILFPILSVVIVSLVSLVGIFTLYINESILRKYVFVFVSLAVGALLGDAFIHLIPGAFENIDARYASLLVILGIIIFFILEKFLHWHHHNIDSDHHIHPVGRMILLSDGLHNFIDGIIIGASYLVGIEVGIATTIAVILHEIPQEIGDFGVLIHSGYAKSRALYLNFISASLAIVGVFFALILGQITEVLTMWFIPLAAGGFIYIAVADLIPELHKSEKKSESVLQITAVIIGILLMVVLLILE